MTSPRAETNPLRILLVEDEALIAIDTQEVLESAGYVVVGPAGRLDIALALAAAELIDAAVLDVNLSGVAVCFVAESLRQRGIPFLFLSGLFTGSDMPASCARTPFVSKPMVPAALLHSLAAVMRAARTGQAALPLIGQ